jgi:UDP:flavonoid glycosyltransferase YjiC (YdhE family)
MKSRMRIAVVSGPAPGHAFPSAAVAVALVAGGHEVTMLTGPDWLAPLRRDGVEPLVLPLLAPVDDHGDFGMRLHDRAAEMAVPCAALLRELRIDGVVADALTVCGGLAAELAELPWVELVPHPLADLSRDLPPVGTGLPRGRTPWGGFRDGVLRRLTARSLRQAEEQRVGVRDSIGLTGPRRPPQRRLVATLPALEVPRSDWPPDARIVGPLFWDSTAVDLEPPPGDDPLVVISDSTSHDLTGALLDAALHGLQGVRAACSTLAPYAGVTPTWAAVGPGRQGPLLTHAAALVCGGGNGIICKGLAAGVPLVVVPGPGDQKENAFRVARTGAGIVIRPEKLTPLRLAAAVAEVVDDPAYRRAAQAAGATGGGLSPAYAARLTAEALTATHRC